MSDVDQRKRDIARFLELCVIYADDSLARKQGRIGDSDAEINQRLTAEIAKWEAFREFVDYTINELENGLLDEWMLRLHDPDFHPEPGG